MSKTGSGKRVTRHDPTRAREIDRVDHQGKPTIPSSRAGAEYHAASTDYLDKLLDEALEETFPASDAVAVSLRR